MSTPKGCELCSNPARMLCDSDDASLCWDCDEKVHSANFLVAKHSRTLLCRVCQSPTPWKAAGPKLGPTVSVCHACAHDNRGASSRNEEDDDGDDYQLSESDDYSESDDFSEEEDEEEDGENQVVPWSNSVPNSPPPATAASSSSSEEDASFSASSKRLRDNPFESEDEDGCCSSLNPHSTELSCQDSDENYSCSSSLLRPLKMQRRSNDFPLIPSEHVAGEPARRRNLSSGTAAIIEKLRRFEQEVVTEEAGASAMIVGLCKLTDN